MEGALRPMSPTSPVPLAGGSQPGLLFNRRDNWRFGTGLNMTLTKTWEDKPVIKQVLDASRSFFLVVCGIAILVAAFSAKSFVEENRLLAQSAREAQEHFLIATAETRGIVTDIGFGWAVLVLTDEEIIPPATANKLLDETIASISKRSERFGKLAKYLNDYRINQEY